MIYLIDDYLTESSHSNNMLAIVRRNTSQQVKLIELGTTISDIIVIIENLYQYVCPADIVLCPWAIPKNLSINGMFDDLADLCWVVVAAGNSCELIDNWTPASAEKVITVGTLNKSGNKASLSNYSADKKIEWVTGTNYMLDKNISGTSVSSALYAAYLAEAIYAKDIRIVDILIKKRAEVALKELC